jgi:mRNA-degrading endonuclease RelE of RelBE toxin-antitoxin system
MIFVETRSFSRRRTEQLTDEQFRLLQLSLLSNPQAGDVIRGTGGLRKLRWATTGRGKRGGVRIIYYRAVERDMILAYSRHTGFRGDR